MITVIRDGSALIVTDGTVLSEFISQNIGRTLAEAIEQRDKKIKELQAKLDLSLKIYNQFLWGWSADNKGYGYFYKKYFAKTIEELLSLVVKEEGK